MKVAQVIGPRQAALLDRPMPAPQGDLVRVRVRSAPMCTEYHAFCAGTAMGVAGHEAVGEIDAVDRSSRYPVGTRVVVQPQYACGVCEWCLAGWHIHCPHQRDLEAETGQSAGRDTFAEYLLKPDWLLTPIPDSISDDHAAMACCGLGPTFGAVRALGVAAPDTVVIFGLGPVGLGGVINAICRGATVIGVDANDCRADLARQLGALEVVDPTASNATDRILGLTGGRGAEVCLETSGIPQAKEMALAVAARRGRIGLVGWQGELAVNSIIAKGLTVVGSWHYNLADAPALLRTIARCAPSIEKLITHRFPLTDIQRAWELQAGGRCGKIVLHPHDSATE